MKKKNIALIGFMGTGKTVTGKILAEKTGMELMDMDSMIEERQQRSIADIFATDGQDAFRAMERELVQELAQKENLIISTGGGIVLNSDNISDLASSGLVVCLTASPNVIFDRLENDSTRPLLSGDKKDQIGTILESRKALYNAIEHQINGDVLDPNGAADAILNLYALES